MRDGKVRHKNPSPWVDAPSGASPVHAFPDTHWSAILRAGRSDGAEARAALCKAYWYPVYGFVRGQGCTNEDACDVTQGFFAMLLKRNDLASVRPERGRFRSWMRTLAKHYLLNELKHARATKRGGSRTHIDIDVASAEQRFQRDFAETLTPEQIFDRCWARTVAERSLARLKAQRPEDEILVNQLLCHEDDRAPDEETAATLAISLQALRTRRSRLWTMFKQSLEEEISGTVDRPDAIDAERAELVDVL